MSENFWNTSNGKDVTQGIEKEYTADGGGFPIIPEKTNCLLLIDKAYWTKDDSFNEYIKLQYSVIGPQAYEGIKVKHNLWVADPNPDKVGKEAQDKKRANDLKMLATIDAICGGKLGKAGRRPDDDDLTINLTGKQLIARLMTYPDRDDKSKPGGNWVAAVAAKGGSMEVTKVDRKPDGSRGAPLSGSGSDDLDDEIPFITMDSIY